MEINMLNEAVEKRSKMEERMKTIVNYLTTPGEDGTLAVGFHGNLLDSEGFPRADIDIFKIREFRHELAELRTDYDELTEQIAQLTIDAFSSVKEKKDYDVSEETVKKEIILLSPMQDTSVIQISEPDHDYDTKYDPLLEKVRHFEEEQAAFSLWKDSSVYIGSIRSVTPGFIAESIGIRECDRIISFGEINVASYTGVNQIAQYVEKCRGKVIDIEVGRFGGDHYDKATIKANIPTDSSIKLGSTHCLLINYRMHFIPRE